ncbi:MAG: DUF3237 domain-containing protein [Acidimicrobiales bacterium]
MATTTIDVEHLFTLSLAVGDTTNALIRNGPAGTRFVAAVPGGTFAGERLRGTVVGPSGDWVSIRPNRTSKLDVRLLLVTDDGESILMSYQGILRPGDGESQVRSAPTFETGSETYAWLNDIQAIGIGRSVPGAVDYEVYALPFDG